MTPTGDTWRVRLAGYAGGTTVSALMRTVTFQVEADPESTQLMERGDPVVYAAWHSGLLPIAYKHRGQGATVLVSQHRDGEVIARILEELGFVTVRGSTTRAGSSGLLALVRRAREGRVVAVTPDGPQGPKEVVQEGVVAVARLTNLPILPIGIGWDRAWEMNSWDRFAVPKPFARIYLHYGRPISVDQSTETALARVQAALDQSTSIARSAAATDKS